MKSRYVCFFAVMGVAALTCMSAKADELYNNLTTNGLIGVASTTSAPIAGEVEAADDFILGSASTINSASFTGVIAAGTFGVPQITGVTIEIYRVFPFDSDTNRAPHVNSRVNSPSDVAFDARSSSNPGDLSFSTSTLSSTFTALNSVSAVGIHPQPNQTTGGNGTVTGQEVQFDVNFTKPLSLDANHYFFVAQVDLSNGGSFYWLSASRPISGPGTTPFAPDLQAWVRNDGLAPDWSRVGTDIVGGPNIPQFNLAFSLDGKTGTSGGGGGTNVPEPASFVLLTAGMALIAGFKKRSWKSYTDFPSL